MPGFIDFPVYCLFRALIALVNILPMALRLSLVRSILRLFFMLFPKHLRVARRNLQLFAPNSPEEQRRILRESMESMARLIVDMFRLHKIDADWVSRHIEFHDQAAVDAVLARAEGKGILLAVGHLGSFELLGYIVPYLHRPVRVVMRHLELKMIDQWVVRSRESSGNRIISRYGGFREILSSLKGGQDVAILFDQNVKINHAVFVDWFGRPAATSGALALAVLSLEVPVMAAAIQYIGDDRYLIKARDCRVHEIFENSELSTEAKKVAITQRISDHYQQLIREDPGGWFWVHRRWRTTPDGSKPSLYEGI